MKRLSKTILLVSSLALLACSYDKKELDVKASLNAIAYYQLQIRKIYTVTHQNAEVLLLTDTVRNGYDKKGLKVFTSPGTYFKYNPSRRLTEEYHCHDQDCANFTLMKYYYEDTSPLISHIIHYEVNHNEDRRDILEHIYYTYDLQKRLVKKNIITQDFPKAPYLTTEYAYDTQKIIKNSSKGKSLPGLIEIYYTYSPKGFLEKEIFMLDKDSSKTHQWIYFYDNHQRNFLVMSYRDIALNDTLPTLNSQTLYKYDKKGRKIEALAYKGQKTEVPYSITRYYYDSLAGSVKQNLDPF